MATKTCINGHIYDPNVYGDNCPFCPSSSAGGGHTIAAVPGGGGTIVNDNTGGGTMVNNYLDNGGTGSTRMTEPVNDGYEGGTCIRPIGGKPGAEKGRKRLVALLVSYDTNPLGEVFKLYEGRNMIGRRPTVDIPVMKDPEVSSEHLLILYREAEGIFWSIDNDSSNGTYVNGVFQNKVALKSNDVITIGSTRLIFLAIPKI